MPTRAPKIDPAQTLAAHVCATVFEDVPAKSLTATRRDVLDVACWAEAARREYIN